MDAATPQDCDPLGHILVALRARGHIFSKSQDKPLLQPQALTRPRGPRHEMQVDSEITGNRARILVADDHVLIRERVTGLLESTFDVVGVVADGQELLNEARRLSPDVIVLDITMPALNGIDAARQLRLSASTAKLVFLTINEKVAFMRRCMAEGEMGYVIKSRLESDLIHAIEEALSGRHFISRPLFR
jgi:CheY-like chemotaxis protein